MPDNKNKPVKLLIVGRTASGKDSFARYIQKISGKKGVLSYATRPKRTPDEDTHIFITPEEANTLKSDAIAYTKIGDAEYFATSKQLDEAGWYIIDPAGRQNLLKNCGDKYDFWTIYIHANTTVRYERFKNRSNQENIEQIFNERMSAENAQFTEFEKELHSNNHIIVIQNNDNDTNLLFNEANTISYMFFLGYH